MGTVESKQFKTKLFDRGSCWALFLCCEESQAAFSGRTPSMNQNWQESKKEQSYMSRNQETAAQRQNSVQGEASLHGLAGFFMFFLTVCLPSRGAAWHPSGNVPCNILRCWGRCCPYQSAGQPWAGCSASPSLTPVAPAGFAAEKHHQRKGVNHTSELCPRL